MSTCESVKLLAGVNTAPVVQACNYLQAVPVSLTACWSQAFFDLR